MSDLDEVPQGKRGTIRERLERLDQIMKSTRFRPATGFVCVGCGKFFDSAEEDGSPPVGCPNCDDEDGQR